MSETLEEAFAALLSRAGGEDERAYYQFLKGEVSDRLQNLDRRLRRLFERAIILTLQRDPQKVHSVLPYTLVAGEPPFLAENPPVPRIVHLGLALHARNHEHVESARSALSSLLRSMQRAGVDSFPEPRMEYYGNRMSYTPDQLRDLLGGNARDLVRLHDILTYAASARRLRDILYRSLQITLPRRILVLESLRLTPKDEAFFAAKRRSGDCTAPGGEAFGTFSVVSLLSDASGNYEIRASTIENDPRRPGRFIVQRHRHVGNLSFMFGEYDGEPAIYVHGIHLAPEYRTVPNELLLGQRFPDLLHRLSRDVGIKHVLLDPIQLGNTVNLSTTVYDILRRIGAKRGDIELFTPHHDEKGRLSDIHMYGSPWAYQRDRGERPIHIPIKRIRGRE